VSKIRLATTLAALMALGAGVACNEPKGPIAGPTDGDREAAERAAREAAERDRAAAERAAREAAERARAAEEAARRAEEAKRAEEARRAMAQAAAAALLDVNFDYNKADVRKADRIKLEAIAGFMRAYPQASVRIEGHCDERGTIEYNLALGERRAYAAKSYLVGLGIGESRFGTVSYGKERPKVAGQSEKSWFVNRRCEFKLQ